MKILENFRVRKIKKCYETISTISDIEEKEFKKHWYTQMILSNLFDKYCVACPYREHCFRYDCVINVKNILAVCKHQEMIEAAKLFTKTKPIAYVPSDDRHRIWIRELERMIK